MVNTLYFGDNLHVLREYVKDESVDLVYLDPPFNSKASYNVLFRTPVGDRADAQVHAFQDTWTWEGGAEQAYLEVSRLNVEVFTLLQAMRSFLGESDVMAYLAMMAPRLIELKRVLRPTGSIYLHCDSTASHYLKILMDGVFRPSNFVNEIIWKRYGAHNDVGQGSKHFGRVSDAILFYSAGGKDRTWNQLFMPLDASYVEETYRYVDAPGRRFTTTPLTAPGGAEKGNPVYEWNGHVRAWRYNKATMQRLHDEGRLYYSKTGYPRQKLYLDESKGVPVQAVWTDIPSLSGAHKERLGYPTQKPLALLERIIAASSNEGDTILDPFCGCGTAVHAAEKLGRQWIGIDITYVAIQVIEDRLKTWLPKAKYRVDGIPKDVLGAQALAKRDPYQFQLWSVGRVGGQPRGRGADRGIDGEIVFLRGAKDYGRAIVSVKGGQHVGPDMVRALKGTLQREGADMGVFICLNQPTKEMKIEAATAGQITLPGGDRPRVQIVTARDLIAGPNLGIVTGLNIIQSAEAARALAKRHPKRPTPEDLRRAPRLKLPISGGKSKGAQKSLPLDEPPLAPSARTRKRRRAS